MKEKERSYMVVKRNDLIQKSRHQLSLQEQKIILYMISKIQPGDKKFTRQIFSIAEFCQICGLDSDNGGNYAYIKKALQSLRDRSVWVTLEDGSETTLAWVNKVTINKRSGLIRLVLDEDMKPFLLDLKESFTQYELLNTLAMRSQYSVRLYELLKSYQYRQSIVFDIDELRRLLFAERWKRGNDLKRKVLDIAMREINSLTDISVTYELIKSGRQFAKVSFTINRKSAFERFEAGQRISHALDSNL
ncbi:MAG: replication initiation protein [Oscillospiraceae bacterium]|nr:replication initiation protein [Oscillospiraceae bacterium]